MVQFDMPSTPTATPTDGWSSYFDSWKCEDKQVPAFEPVIVDDELHPGSLQAQFNVNFELDWAMDLQDGFSPMLAPTGCNGKLNHVHPAHQRHGVVPSIGRRSDRPRRPLEHDVAVGRLDSGWLRPPRSDAAGTVGTGSAWEQQWGHDKVSGRLWGLDHPQQRVFHAFPTPPTTTSTTQQTLNPHTGTSHTSAQLSPTNNSHCLISDCQISITSLSYLPASKPILLHSHSHYSCLLQVATGQRSDLFLPWPIPPRHLSSRLFILTWYQQPRSGPVFASAAFLRIDCRIAFLLKASCQLFFLLLVQLHLSSLTSLPPSPLPLSSLSALDLVLPPLGSAKMSTIQNLKNFIRHGKQARAPDHPRDQPTTDVSPIHAQHQKYAVSDPVGVNRHVQQHVKPHHGEYSAAAVDNRNVAAQAGGAAAHAAGKTQKIQADIHAIVAEEREKAGKMPRYPGLERFVLVEKMGDGAFSNVYKARDTQTGDEVAIKVVRKFEMNSNQVCPVTGPTALLDLPLHLFPSRLLLCIAFSPPPPCSVFHFKTQNQPSNLGRCTPSSEFQKATKGCGGAHIHSPSLPRFSSPNLVDSRITPFLDEQKTDVSQ